MKFALASDLHLEFGMIDLHNEEDADMLILAGDIFVTKRLLDSRDNKQYLEFIENVSSRFDKVIYIMGNHEHYHGDFALSESRIREVMSSFTNIHFLHNQHVDLCGYRFYGGTMWTDCNKSNPITMMAMRGKMNDYVLVENSEYMIRRKDSGGNTYYKPGKLLPEETAIEHSIYVRNLTEVLNDTEDMPMIVISHHLPSYQSVPPEYYSDTEGNYAYVADMTSLIMDNDKKIKYWIHGHTHDACDYMIGDTRVLCNPRGYIGHERDARFFKLKYYEV